MLKEKIEKIFCILDSEKQIDIKAKTEKFLNLLAQNFLVLYDQKEIIQDEREFYSNMQDKILEPDYGEIFLKLSSLVQKNTKEKQEMINTTRELCITLLTLLKDTTSRKIIKNNPHLFDIKNAKNIQDFYQLKEKWEEILKSQGHILLQKRIVSIIVRLILIGNFHDRETIQKLTSILLEVPESITDAEILEQLETLCKIGEGIQSFDCEIDSIQIDRVLQELQEALDTNAKEIRQLQDIKEQIIYQSNHFLEDEKSKILEEEIYNKIHFLNQSLQKKEEHIKELNLRLQELTSALKNMEEKSQKDGLTKLYNRCYVDEVMKHYETRFIRNNLNYSILFFDVDGFKKVNDKYGHLAGDKLLEIFAQILRQNSRVSDVIGRYGGDEFLILMPNTNIDLAKDVAIRICSAISKQRFCINNEDIEVTTSIGVAHRMDYKSREDMLEKADMLLYKAKKGGRNQVQWQ